MCRFEKDKEKERKCLVVLLSVKKKDNVQIEKDKEKERKCLVVLLSVRNKDNVQI